MTARVMILLVRIQAVMTTDQPDLPQVFTSVYRDRRELALIRLQQRMWRTNYAPQL